MQTFQDTATLQVWAFEDDVIVEENNGVYSFTTAHGLVLNTPKTLQPYTPPAPTSAQLLAQAQQAQLAIVGAACASAITGGFQSSALGKAYTYPSQQTDQANLNANVVSSLLPGLPANWTTMQLCCDENGKWGYVPHTAAQIQQVGADGKAAILGCLTKHAELKAQIAAATTVAEVQAINW